MKKLIYLARHGETDWNLEHRMQGRVDIPMNAVGEEQAGRLADSLAGIKIAAIVSSPLRRAARTAEIVGGKLGLPVAYNPNLIERSFGEAEGLLREEMIEKFADALVREGGHIHWGKTRMPGGESADEHSNRLAKALADILSGDSDNVLIITHGANAQSLLNITGLKNCCCFSGIYDTETRKISDA